MGLQEYGSAVYNATTRSYKQLLDECGVHDCKNSFCGGEWGQPVPASWGHTPMGCSTGYWF